MEEMTDLFFFFQAEDGIRDGTVAGVQTCALPISRALEDANDAAFAPMLSCLTRSDFGAAWRDIATDPRHHPVAVHCGAGILSRDENVRLSRLFRDKETVTGLMDR